MQELNGFVHSTCVCIRDLTQSKQLIRTPETGYSPPGSAPSPLFAVAPPWATASCSRPKQDAVWGLATPPKNLNSIPQTPITKPQTPNSKQDTARMEARQAPYLPWSAPPWAIASCSPPPPGWGAPSRSPSAQVHTFSAILSLSLSLSLSFFLSLSLCLPVSLSLSLSPSLPLSLSPSLSPHYVCDSRPDGKPRVNRVVRRSNPPLPLHFFRRTLFQKSRGEGVGGSG